jgi:hypothetical protein
VCRRPYLCSDEIVTDIAGLYVLVDLIALLPLAISIWSKPGPLSWAFTDELLIPLRHDILPGEASPVGLPIDSSSGRDTQGGHEAAPTRPRALVPLPQPAATGFPVRGSG